MSAIPDKLKDFLWKVHSRYSSSGILAQNLEIKQQVLAKKPGSRLKF